MKNPVDNPNRYSVYCATHGCIQSRDVGLRDARHTAGSHRHGGCLAEITAWHYTVNHEDRGQPVPPDQWWIPRWATRRIQLKP